MRRPECSALASILFLCAAAGALEAQVPERINFQGRLTKGSSVPVNQTVAITFRLYSTSTGGSPIWSEAQNVPVVNGNYSVYLGEVSPLGTLAFNTTYWLSIEVAGDGEMTPRYMVSSSPYSLRAKVADALQGLTTPPSQLNQFDGIGATVTAGTLNALTNLSNADLLHLHDWSAITGKPAAFPAAPHGHSAADLTSGFLASARLQGTYSNALVFSNAANSFVGNGSGLTLLDPAALSPGLAAIDISGNAATVTNGVVTTGSYANPTWIPSLAGGKIAGPVGDSAALGGLPAATYARLDVAQTFGAPQTVQTGAPANFGLVIQGAAGQTANLQEWKNSAGTTLASISPLGGWQGSPIAPAFGGTGIDSSGVAAGSLLRSTAAGTWSLLPPAANGKVLKLTAGLPAWEDDLMGAGGTVTSVGSGLGLLGGPITGSGSLAIDPAVVPQLGAANNFTNPGNSFSGSGAGLTNLNPANLGAGTAGINISGNAATVTNGVVTTGAYADPAWITALSGAKIAGTVANAGSLAGVPGASYARLDQAQVFTMGGQVVQTGAAGNVGFVVQGFAGQTANLQEWRDSTGALLAQVNASGGFVGSGAGLLNLNPANLLPGTAPISITGGSADSSLLAGQPGSFYLSLANQTGVLPVTKGGTGSALQNFVDLTTDQTAAGKKIFAPSADVPGVVVRQTTAAAPTADIFAVQDSAGGASFLRVDNAGQLSWTGSASGNISGVASGFSGGLLGDVTGTQGATSVVRLQGRSVSSVVPASGQVLAWNGAAWAPASGGGAGTVTQVASGLGLTGGPITASGSLAIDPLVVPQLGSANTFSTGAQTIQTGGGANRGLILQGAAAQAENLMEWKDDAGNVLGSINAAGLLTGSGANLTNLNASALTTGTLPAGALGGTYTGAISFTNASNVFSGSGAGLTGLNPANLSAGTAAIDVSGSAATFTGALAGDVTGTQASTTVARLRGTNVSAAAPAANQVLRYDGTEWKAAAVNLNTDTTGMLPILQGGTGATTATQALINLGGANLVTPNTFTQGNQTILTGNLSSKALVLRGVAGQSANLQEWQDSAATPVAQLSTSSGFQISTSGSTTITAGNTLASGVAIAVMGTSNSTAGTGLLGSAGAATGVTKGVQGSTASTSGFGVHGIANAGTGNTRGVVGDSASTSGIGVLGQATAATGLTSGVYGVSNSPTGRGVVGQNTSPVGPQAYGVWGLTASNNGRGVYGQANASAGATYGVAGESSSTSGVGVQGLATAVSGSTYGVFGQSESTTGIGVQGQTTATTGNSFGVEGSSASDSGRGVFGIASSPSGATTGVYGLANSSSGTGVFGLSPATGVSGQATSTTGRGVSGFAMSATGFNAGVFGTSFSTSGTGVIGNAQAATGSTFGVRGSSASSAGVGMLGEALAGSGTTYGVYGAVNSPSGFGLYTPNNAFVGGTLTAGGYSGSGATLTNLNASNLTTGIIGDGRIEGNYTRPVTFSDPANSFSGSGANLTALNASNVASGTLAEPRVDAAIARDTEVLPLVLAADGAGSGLDADLLDGSSSADFAFLPGRSGGQVFYGGSDAGNTLTIRSTTNATKGNLLLVDDGGKVLIGNPPSAFARLSVGGGTDVGLHATTDSATNYGVYGQANSPTGLNAGVLGHTLSSEGSGVWGLANANSGNTVGVRGESYSNDGRGVFGYAGNTAGTTYGVVGQSVSTDGVGVWARATAATGQTYGLHATADSTSGNAVFAHSTAASGFNFGIYARNHSPNGVGVYSENLATTGAAFAFFGQTSSTGGIGVRGSALATTGNAFGVSGSSASTIGAGILAQATAPTGATHGVRAFATSDSGTGVFASATSITGATTGVRGQVASTGGVGVEGVATAAGGATAGVRGQAQSTSGVGVFGLADASSGSTKGVMGQTDSNAGIGVHGTSTSATGGRGVTGEVASSNGIAVYGEVLGSGGAGKGVHGRVASPTGSTIGVHGESGSVSGYGVYGEATSTTGIVKGVYGSTVSVDPAAGVFGSASNASGVAAGVIGESDAAGGTGVIGRALSSLGGWVHMGVQAYATGGTDNIGLLASVSGGTPPTPAQLVRPSAVVGQSISSEDIYQGYDSLWNLRFRVAGNGDVQADGTYTTPAADLAERVPGSEPMEPGDVVEVDPGATGVFRRSRTPYTSRIAGIVSTRPGVLLGHEEGSKDAPLALAGRVPVKVTLEGGAIRPGDLLTASSTPGRAMKATEAWRGGIVGTALEAFDGTGEAKITALVHLNPAPAADPEVIEVLKKRLEDLESVLKTR